MVLKNSAKHKSPAAIRITVIIYLMYLLVCDNHLIFFRENNNLVLQCYASIEDDNEVLRASLYFIALHSD